MMETHTPFFCLLAGKSNLLIIHRFVVEIILTCCLIGSLLPGDNFVTVFFHNW